MAAGSLRVVDGAKHYGAAGSDPADMGWVFRGLNLEVAPGELFCLLGPSGCGKSTLLRTMAGLDQLSAGRLEIDGVEPAPGVTGCGLVFQEPMLLPWLDVRANIGLGLRYRRNRAHRDAGVIEATAEVMGIGALLDRSPTEISGGQAQRVALARTIVTRPEILLLDEPFAALDPGTRNGLQDWLLEVVGRLGVTTVFVTHDVDEAIHLGGRIGVLAGSGGGLSRIWDVASVSRNGARTAAVRDELLEHVTGVAGGHTEFPNPMTDSASSSEVDLAVHAVEVAIP